MSEENNENNENDENEEEKPKSSKKLLIIGLLLGLLVGGGAAAGFFIMQAESGAEEEHVEEVVEEKAPELPDYQYARMDRLNLPLFYKGRVLNYAVMDVSLETIGTEDKMVVVKNVILIRDALLRHYSVNSIGREDNPRIVDYDSLTETIKEFANKEIGEEIVTRVVIGESRSL